MTGWRLLLTAAGWGRPITAAVSKHIRKLINGLYFHLGLSASADFDSQELTELFLVWLSTEDLSSRPLDNVWAMMIVWRIRGKIIRTVLCCIVWHNCAQSYVHWYEWFLQMDCFRISVCTFLCFYCGQFICVRVSFCVLCIFCLSLFGCQYQCSKLPGKTRLWNESLCVECDVKPYTLTHCSHKWTAGIG